MKHAFLFVLSFVGILRAATVSNVTLRQDWPWSGRMTVNYTLSDVTNTVKLGIPFTLVSFPTILAA